FWTVDGQPLFVGLPSSPRIFAAPHVGFLLVDGFVAHRDLPSFPTRRSSDLVKDAAERYHLRTGSAPRGSRRRGCVGPSGGQSIQDRKSTRLNSSHVAISYAVFCLKKKTIDNHIAHRHDERACPIPLGLAGQP